MKTAIRVLLNFIGPDVHGLEGEVITVNGQSLDDPSVIKEIWGYLDGDIDGDALADFSIDITGSAIPEAGHFIL